MFERYLDERRHGDRRAALISFVMWNCWAKEKKSFEDFMLTPERKPKKKQTVKEMLFIAEMLTAAMGGQDLRRKTE